MLFSSVFAKLQPVFPARLAPKSFSLYLFADPHPINPVVSILYKNMGEGCPRNPHRSSLSSTFRTLFQVPYPVSPVVATLTKTAGVCTNNSHSGTLFRLSPALSRNYFDGTASRFLRSAASALSVVSALIILFLWTFNFQLSTVNLLPKPLHLPLPTGVLESEWKRYDA